MLLTTICSAPAIKYVVLAEKYRHDGTTMGSGEKFPERRTRKQAPIYYIQPSLKTERSKHLEVGSLRERRLDATPSVNVRGFTLMSAPQNYTLGTRESDFDVFLVSVPYTRRPDDYVLERLF